MKLRTTFLLWLLLAGTVWAQSVATSVIGNASLTNSLVVSSKPGTKLYALTGYNSASSTQYIQILQTNGVPTNAVTPTFSIPVAAGNYYSFDFSTYGADLNKITVVVSTNAATVGLAPANTSIQAIIRQY